MISVVELFSGIGSQVKALKKANLNFVVKNIAEWDINSLVAYDIIHNESQDLQKYSSMSKETLIEELYKLGLSMNGKEAMSYKSLQALNIEALKRIKAAIDRTNNLVNIEKIKGSDLPKEIDLLTYSFPCQDLSNMGAIHGYTNGIDRKFKTRSGMLWQVERILLERFNSSLEMPRILMLENVPSLNSSKHKNSFEGWKKQLEDIGYVNIDLTLNALQFGVPQNRNRLILLSFLKKDIIKRGIAESDLESLRDELINIKKTINPLQDYLRLDSINMTYRNEMILSTPNLTPSRQEIINKNPIICDEGTSRCLRVSVPTITTKQDRHPNSGLIFFGMHPIPTHSKYRYLTPRECFLLMGFDEDDYNKILSSNFQHRSSSLFFTRDKLYKMAGNSIVVDVLEEIFAALKRRKLI